MTFITNVKFTNHFLKNYCIQLNETFVNYLYMLYEFTFELTYEFTEFIFIEL